MLWINFKRILKSGFVNFWRNSYVSLASVVVMIVTLFVISTVLFGSAILSSVLNTIKDKVDINVYFVNEASEENILTLKKQIEVLPEVARVEYVSRETALADFKARHENDQVTLQALDEIGENPLGAVLNVKAKEASQYASIADFLKAEEDRSGNSIIEKVTYFQNKEAIDALSRTIEAGRKLGAIITTLFVLISIIITFNTIRLAIYISRDEISVMKLVGAGFMYIRGPFVVGGIMAGAISAIITLIILYPLTLWLGPITERLFAGVSVFGYYMANFGQIFVILVLSGTSIGAISSYLAVRKYLAK